jgi:hypothetical protein
LRSKSVSLISENPGNRTANISVCVETSIRMQEHTGTQQYTRCHREQSCIDADILDHLGRAVRANHRANQRCNWLNQTDFGYIECLVGASSNSDLELRRNFNLQYVESDFGIMCEPHPQYPHILLCESLLFGPLLPIVGKASEAFVMLAEMEQICCPLRYSDRMRFSAFHRTSYF